MAAVCLFVLKSFGLPYLNEASHVWETEVREFNRRYGEASRRSFQSYHYNKAEQAKAKATEILQVATEVLQEKSRCL